MITGEEIWAALMADPTFAPSVQDPKIRKVRRAIVEQLPTVLRSHLDKKATHGALLRAKIAYGQWLLSTDFILQQIKAQPEEELKQVDIKKVESNLRELAEGAVAAMNHKLMFTDDEAPAEIRGLNKATRELQKQGTLTIEDLLRLQPQIFVHEQGSQGRHASKAN